MTKFDYAAKIRNLLDRAEDPRLESEHERAAFRAKAEQLMREYRISEEKAIAKDPTSVEPELRNIVVTTRRSEFLQNYVNLFWVVAKHCGVRVHFTWNSDGKVLAQSVGYAGDLEYADMLFTRARMVFSEKLEPKVEAHYGEQVNVYRLRGAGMERVRVAQAVFGNTEKATLSKVGRMYKAECKARGEAAALDGRGVTGKVYREQYAEEFVWHLSARLRNAQDAAGQFGGTLVLAGRSERVDEAFYTNFPSYRPSTEVAEIKDCEKCKTTKHESGKCKDCRPRAITKADLARYARYNSPAAVRGREAGVSAARHVSLDRAGRDGVEGTAAKEIGR